MRKKDISIKNIGGKMKKLFSKLFILILVTVLLVSCAQPAVEVQPEAPAAEEESEAEEPVAEEEPQEVFTIACVPPALVSPFHITWTEKVKELGANDPNVEVIVQAPTVQTDVEALVNILEDMIEKKVDLILVGSSAWEAIAPTMEKGINAGVNIIYIDRILPVEGFDLTPLSMLGSDEIEGGQFAGEFIAEALDGEGKVAILTGPAGSYHSQQRQKGFDEVIVNYPGIEVVSRQPAMFQRDLALTVMENILQANPDLDLVWGLNDNMALGALTAIEAVNRQDQVKIVGYNGDQEGLEMVEAGKFLATLKSQPAQYATQVMTEVVPLLMAGNDDEVNPVYPIHVLLVTSDNVAEVLE